MNYNRIFDIAIHNQETDHDQLKAFFLREYKKAERDHFYTKDSFYNSLLKVITRNKTLIKFWFDNKRECLEQTINNIDSYKPYPTVSSVPFDEIDIDEYRKTERAKLLTSSQDELKNITIYNFKTRSASLAPLAKVELIERVINELFKEPTPKKNKVFSVPEWATIFYYANTTKLLPEKTIKDKLTAFNIKHNIGTTDKSLRTRYYEVNNRINKTLDYPIKKLEYILPFLKEHYTQTVTKVKNDILLLEEEKTDY